MAQRRRSMNWQRSERQPALVVHPPAAVSLDEAHAAIEQWEHYSAKQLDPDQCLAVELMMAETSEGTWAAETTGRPMSRQNGKGDEIEVVEAWGLTQRAEAIMHTSHEIPTAKSAHMRLVGLLESHKDLRRKVKQVRYANGDQSVEMVNGGIIVYRTRTGGGLRGLDDISRLVVDEAQHAQPEQLASATPILAANPNPQLNAMGSAGIVENKKNRSEWWWSLRKRAMTPDPGRFAWLEHSAERVSLDADDKVVSVAPDPLDREAWLVANPGLPSRIRYQFLEEQLLRLGPGLFAREHLCVWDPEPVDDEVPTWLVISEEQWEACLAEVDAPMEPKGWALDVSPDSASAAIVSSDGVAVEVVAVGSGTDWVVEHLKRLKEVHRFRQIAMDTKGPVSLLLDDLTRAGIRYREVTFDEHAQACGQLLDAVQRGQFAHIGQEPLDDAVRLANRRSVTDRWLWTRSKSEGDIAPLVAATLARWWAGQRSRTRPMGAYR